jgi:hypothetical protein
MDKADIRQFAGGDLTEGRKSATASCPSADMKKSVALDVIRLAGISPKVARALR